jgi:hypothetical protein
VEVVALQGQVEMLLRVQLVTVEREVLTQFLVQHRILLAVAAEPLIQVRLELAVKHVAEQVHLEL